MRCKSTDFLALLVNEGDAEEVNFGIQARPILRKSISEVGLVVGGVAPALDPLPQDQLTQIKT
jgi:hypothetical protein